MSTNNQFQDEPCFVISVAARIVGVHAQTLRHYERVGLIWPSRTGGRQRLYSMADIEELEREVKQLTEAVNTLQRQSPNQRPAQGRASTSRI